MPSHEEDYLASRIQLGKEFHQLLEQSWRVLAEMGRLKTALFVHRQIVIDNPLGIFHPGDLEGVDTKLVPLRDALQAFISSLPQG